MHSSLVEVSTASNQPFVVLSINNDICQTGSDDLEVKEVSQRSHFHPVFGYELHTHRRFLNHVPP